MQLAERWLGLGTIAALIAVSPLVLQVEHTTRAIADEPPVDLTAHRCSEPRLTRATATDDAPMDAADPYQRVFAAARPQLASCFGAETRVELLITIEPDGHVAKVSTRPDPSTPATRCLAAVIETLRFPEAATAIAIRVPLTAR